MPDVPNERVPGHGVDFPYQPGHRGGRRPGRPETDGAFPYFILSITSSYLLLVVRHLLLEAMHLLLVSSCS